MLQEALDEFAAGVFGFAAQDVGGVAREQGLRLDVDEERGHVDELAGCVDVDLLEVVGVLEELAGDAGDGDVVDVDVLLADEVEQKVERAVVDLAYGDGERGLGGFFFFLVLVLGGALWFGWWRRDWGMLEGEGLGGLGNDRVRFSRDIYCRRRGCVGSRRDGLFGSWFGMGLLFWHLGLYRHLFGISSFPLKFAALQINRRSFDSGGKSAASAQDDTSFQCRSVNANQSFISATAEHPATQGPSPDGRAGGFGWPGGGHGRSHPRGWRRRCRGRLRGCGGAPGWV